MPWGSKKAMGMGNGPYSAKYNQNFTGATSSGANPLFANNDPNQADVGPYNYAGVGPDPVDRAYRNPLNVAVGPEGGDGYLGMAVGERELQTGNAPSGGYEWFPQYVAGFQANVVPDNRRTMQYRPSDWEHDQVNIHERRDAELRYRREINVDEDWVQFQSLPMPDHQVNAIEDSPYRKDWPDGHAAGGREGGTATYRTNPNRFRNTDNWDQSSTYKNSGSRYLNGTHFSFAQHNSLQPYVNQYEGGTPTRQLRNTYRLDPQPWDTTNTDGPSNTGGYDTVTNLYGGAYGNAYRLG